MKTPRPNFLPLGLGVIAIGSAVLDLQTAVGARQWFSVTLFVLGGAFILIGLRAPIVSWVSNRRRPKNKNFPVRSPHAPSPAGLPAPVAHVGPAVVSITVESPDGSVPTEPVAWAGVHVTDNDVEDFDGDFVNFQGQPSDFHIERNRVRRMGGSFIRQVPQEGDPRP